MPTTGLLTGHRIDEIPASHLDLVECPPVAALTTVMPDGYPRGTVVEMTEEGALAHLDALASRYAGHPIRYFGKC